MKDLQRHSMSLNIDLPVWSSKMYISQTWAPLTSLSPIAPDLSAPSGHVSLLADSQVCQAGFLLKACTPGDPSVPYRLLGFHEGLWSEDVPDFPTFKVFSSLFVSVWHYLTFYYLLICLSVCAPEMSGHWGKGFGYSLLAAEFQNLKQCLMYCRLPVSTCTTNFQKAGENLHIFSASTMAFCHFSQLTHSSHTETVRGALLIARK